MSSSDLISSNTIRQNTNRQLSEYKNLSYQARTRVQQSTSAEVRKGRVATQTTVRKAVGSTDQSIQKHIRENGNAKLTKTLQSNLDPASRGRKIDLKL